MTLEKTIEDGLGPCYKKLATLEEGVSKMMRMLMEEKNDMGSCIEKLDKVGWAAQDPMYDTALLLFGQSANYRKLWLHLKPESCGNWVKSVGSVFRKDAPLSYQKYLGITSIAFLLLGIAISVMLRNKIGFPDERHRGRYAVYAYYALAIAIMMVAVVLT
uniref:L10-interacting MYB domain-containing protein-like n=1 Tax=Tanacetum cinerariifolium TaxID=118510 RepID=A0A699L4K2_TANCI|nr:L10-interacting MYB domain-containing protein-like [Tanacetum cinerariifolium]